jgi:F-type H+-transporting ATPase subunit epsilon
MSEPHSQLRLKVVTPTRIAAEADADEITLPGVLGMLGLLPGHAPLLAALRVGEMSYRNASVERHLAVRAGFVEVDNDAVMVLVDGAERPDEIDVEQARADRLVADEAMRSASEEAFDRARDALDLASARLAVAARR